MTTDKDYVFITFEAKMSKKYQSMGVSIGYGSAKKSNETVEKLFRRVEDIALAKFTEHVEILEQVVEQKGE